TVRSRKRPGISGVIYWPATVRKSWAIAGCEQPSDCTVFCNASITRLRRRMPDTNNEKLQVVRKSLTSWIYGLGMRPMNHTRRSVLLAKYLINSRVRAQQPASFSQKRLDVIMVTRFMNCQKILYTQ